MSVDSLIVPTEVTRGGPDNTYRWATVTQLGPLRVRFDGDSADIPFTPDTLVDPGLLSVGKRVWVQLFGRRLLILGVSGGEYKDSGWVDLTPSSGFTSNGAQVRQLGKVVRFAGTLSGTIAVSTTTQIATVPVGFRPARTSNFNSAQTSGAWVVWANVTTLGALSVHIKPDYPGGTALIDLTAISYTID